MRRSKEKIFYIRDYRHFRANAAHTAIFLFLIVLPVVCFMTFAFPIISRKICEWAGPILTQALPAKVSRHEVMFIPFVKPIAVLSLAGHAPSFTQTILVLIFCLAAIIIIWQIDKGLRSVFIYVSMSLWILLVSCLFFLFWPEYFPYTLTEFSSLYMLQQASMNIMLPALLGVALSLLPSGAAVKALAILIDCISNIIFTAVRYVFYLYVLAKFSSLYMAPLYFCLGVLFDFIRTVLFFAFCAKRVSEQMQTPVRRGQWDWT